MNLMGGHTKRNPLGKYGIDLKDIDELPEVNAGVNDFMEGEVVPAWKANAPVDSGEYRDGIKVTEPSTNRGRGKVGATSDNAHLVEFGSVHNPEFAPAEKTAGQFGGTATSKAGRGRAKR